MKSAANQIVIRIVVGLLFMLASVCNLFSFLKEAFQDVWQGNFNTPEPPSMWLWVVLGLVGVVICIRGGMAWDRIQDAEATNQSK